MNKKGDVLHHTFFIIFELVLVVGIGIGMFWYVTGIKSDIRFSELYLVHDLGLYLGGAQTSSNAYNAEYGNEGLVNFTIQMEKSQNGMLKLYQPVQTPYGPDRKNEISTPFGAQKEMKVFSYQKQKKLTVKQNASGTEVVLNSGENRFFYQCTGEERGYQYLIDIGHGGDDKGIIVGGKKESEMLMRFVQESGIGEQTTRSVAKDETITQFERARKIAGHKGPFVSIHTGRDSLGIYAYIGNNNKKIQSAEMACRILNKLGQYGKVKHITIIPVEVEDLEFEDHRKILTAKEFGIVLEIGDLSENSLLLDKGFAKIFGESLREVSVIA